MKQETKQNSNRLGSGDSRDAVERSRQQLKQVSTMICRVRIDADVGSL